VSAIFVVGSINTDLIVQVPRLPAPGETVIGGTFKRTQGGKGANQAVAAARLGARTRLVGMAGKDAFGEEAVAELRAAGVDCSCILTGLRPTGVAVIVANEAGENLIAVASGANEELSAESVTAALRRSITVGDVVIANLEVPDPAVLAAAREAHAVGAAFILNPAPARPLDRELLAACDVVTPNEYEVGSMGFLTVDDLLGAGVAAVVVTLGARGADLHRRDAPPVHQDAIAVDVVDTVGAGDAFSAALAWALAANRAIEDAVRLAAAAGALSTRAAGARTGLPNADEVVALAGP
jgi:ribokinase